MESRLKENNFSEDIYLPKAFRQSVHAKTFDLAERLKTKHILIMNGEKDVLVKAEFNQPVVQSLRKIHVGKEGYDWKYYLVPDCGHEWVPAMFESSVSWTYQWLIKNKNDAKL
jgi:predicted esterase